MRLTYWTYEGTAHHGVGRVANSMKGVHAVFHAPQGDGYVVPVFSMLERAPDHPTMTTSIVDGRGLTMGEIRLPETLRRVDAKHKPELIVIAASCSTILLQENLDIIADEADTNADVLVYDANPYRMAEVTAAEGLLTALVKRYAAPIPRTEQPSVNIIGPASLGFHVRPDLIALRRMLATLGVKINVVAPLGASVDDLRRLPAAWATIAPYRELGPGAATYLEHEFGVPVLDAAPIGVQPTLRWLNSLIDLLNSRGASLELPPLTAFSLDGMSAPSGVPWFARTADMDSFISKRAFVFGDATHTAAVVKFLCDELGMGIAGAGTYLANQADWLREQLDGYLDGDLLVTDRFQDVAAVIEETMPDLLCGTQMERHSGRKLDVPCMVIAPPTHIENHLLSYTPMLGFAGADYIADQVYTTTKLGLEKHLIDLFGDAGLDYEETTADNAPESAPEYATNGHTNGVNATDEMIWAPDADKLLRKVPFFVRGKVRRNTEKYAAEQGVTTVTASVLQAAREALGG